MNDDEKAKVVKAALQELLDELYKKNGVSHRDIRSVKSSILRTEDESLTYTERIALSTRVLLKIGKRYNIKVNDPLQNNQNKSNQKINLDKDNQNKNNQKVNLDKDNLNKNNQKVNLDKDNQNDNKNVNLNKTPKSSDTHTQYSMSKSQNNVQNIQYNMNKSQNNVQNTQYYGMNNYYNNGNMPYNGNNLYNKQNDYSFKFDKKPEDYLLGKNIENYLSDMIDKYYGDKNKERAYNAAMRRFKQNLQKDPVTGKEVINFYPDKENDLKILQLELYEEKSERLARAAQGESVYNSIREMQEDKAYIDTKNYSYNRYISTKNNLVTLGKYGEKVNYLAVRTEPNVLKKIGHALVNIPLGVRNVGAIVYRGIGKPVSKLYGKIAKTDSGIYSNKPAHRYEARKDYFINQETKKLQAEGKNPQPIRTLFKARIKALVNYKEGNAAVLEAGYQDIKKSFTEKAKANYFSDKLEAMDKHIDDLKNMKNALYIKPLSPENAMKINEIERAEKETEQMKQKILTSPKLQELIKDGKINTREVVQTDAISYNQHDRANKANVTRTITGIKAIGNVGIHKFVGPRIKDWMLEHCKVQEVKENVVFAEAAPKAQTQQGHEWVKSVVTTEEVPDYVTKISSQEKLLDQFSIKNIMKNSKDNSISYAYNNAGDTGVIENMDFFRGAAQKINGKVVSLSDANGFDSSKITSGVIPEELLSEGTISDNANLFDILAALQKQAGNDVTAQDLVNKVLKCNSFEEQQKMIAEMSDGLDFWKSRSQTGIANGWNSTHDEIQNIINNSQDSLLDSVQVGTHTVKHVTKGHSDFITMPGEEMINNGSETILYGPEQLMTKVEKVTELVDNPRIVKALNIADEIKKGATVMDAITMFFENVRDTKSNAKENKEKPRNYNPQPESNKVNFKGKSKKEDKQIYNTKRKEEENDVTTEIKDIDDEISR